MEYAIQPISGGKEIQISGRMTFADFRTLKSLSESLVEGDKLVVFNLAQVEFIDSAALGMILLARDAAHGKGVSFSLKGAKGQVKRLMELAKLDKILKAA